MVHMTLFCGFIEQFCKNQLNTNVYSVLTKIINITNSKNEDVALGLLKLGINVQHI